MSPPVLYRYILFRHVRTWDKRHIPNEEAELLLLPYILDPDSVCVDIGAHIGLYTYAASNVVGQKNIFAIEPNPSAAKQLQRAFPKVHLHELALSDVQGEIPFKIPKLNGILYPTRGKLNITWLEPNETSAIIYTVPVNTLDTFVQEQNIRKLDFIKIDVEGNEAAVLRGGMNCIRACRPVILAEIEQRHHHFPVSEIFDLLLKEGYVSFYFDTEKLELVVIPEDISRIQDPANMRTAKYYHNFFFLPVEKVDMGLPEKINSAMHT